MIKFYKYLGIIAAISLAGCQTSERSVEKLVYQRASSPVKINPYKNEFAKNIQGTYTMIDESTLTVNADGDFKIGDITYHLFDALSDHQGIYVAETPVENNKKMYTYHGLVVSDDRITVAPFKAPSFKDKAELTAKDTEHYWAVNTFQPENIDWESGFNSKFASKATSKT